MAVIEGGNVIYNADTQAEGTEPRRYYGYGEPADDGQYSDVIQSGETYIDMDNGNIYEWDGSTFTRIDTE